MQAARSHLRQGSWPGDGRGVHTQVSPCEVEETTDYHVDDCLVPAVLVGLVTGTAALAGENLTREAGEATAAYKLLK
jgi:hypothetical protein